MADRLKHAPYLPVLAFNQRHFVPRVIRFAQQADFCRRGAYRSRSTLARLVADANSVAQLLHVFFLRLAGNFHQIGFRNVRSREGQEVGKLAVVRKN
jgi:hypothetical protein